MELKVWVCGIQRIVCGVTAETTCQDVIMALAHATGQTGRFVLLEQWKEHEKYLLPGDKPLEILEKWGEYASGVRFVLRKSRSGTSTNMDLTSDTDTSLAEPRTRQLRENVRSPGSGSSLPSPQSSLRRGNPSVTDFTKRIVDNGAVEDLVKFIALQRERLQLLKEEAELLDGEENSLAQYAELDQLKQKEQILNEKIRELSAFDCDSDDVDTICGEIYPTIVTNLNEEKERVKELQIKIESETSKAETLTDELGKARDEQQRMETLENERKDELEMLRKELESSQYSIVRTEEKLNEVLADLGKCIDQVRLREGVLQELRLVLKSS